MEIEEKLSELAALRAQWKLIESENAETLERTKALEREIKLYCLENGCELAGAGLKVSPCAPRVTYDGKALYDMSGHLREGLLSVESEVWTYAGQAPDDMLERLNNLLSGMRSMVERALTEAQKIGDMTIRIAEERVKK